MTSVGATGLCGEKPGFTASGMPKNQGLAKTPCPSRDVCRASTKQEGNAHPFGFDCLSLVNLI
jgi:hypothetical protein